MRQRRKMCVHVHVHVVDLLVGVHRRLSVCMSVCGFVTDYCSSLSPNDTLSLYRMGALQ